MRREGPLRRKTPLVRKDPLQSRSPERFSGPPRPPKPNGQRLSQGKKLQALGPGETVWKRKRYGRCAACGAYGRVIWHHVLTEQMIVREASPEQLAAGARFDPRNALPLGAPGPWGGRCDCHAAHHAASRRLPLRLVSADARRFAAEILGEERAADWFARFYWSGTGHA